MGGLGCDNMTVILVCFLHEEGYKELARRCFERHVDIKPNQRTVQTYPETVDLPNGAFDSGDSHPFHYGGHSPSLPGISKLSPEHSTSLDACVESASLIHSEPDGERVNGFGDKGVNDSSEEEAEDALETTV